jgi:ethanolamine ammonia-lyase small subunit
MAELDTERVTGGLTAAGPREPWPTSAAATRDTYIRRPDLGHLPDAGEALAPSAGRRGHRAGRRALGIAANLSGPAFAIALASRLTDAGLSHGPVILAQQARVALGDPIAVGAGAQTVVVALGERPGLSAADSLGVYITHTPRIGIPDSARNCLSNIRDGGMDVETAADRTMALIQAMRGIWAKAAWPSARPLQHGALPGALQPGNGVAKTRTPVARSSSAVSSAKSWLIPLIEGTNSIATGITRDRFDASCSAPDGIDRQRPGATASAASASTPATVRIHRHRRQVLPQAHRLDGASVVAATSSSSATIAASIRSSRSASMSRHCSVNSARPGTIEDALGCTRIWPMVQTLCGVTILANRSGSSAETRAAAANASAAAPWAWCRHGSAGP